MAVFRRRPTDAPDPVAGDPVAAGDPAPGWWARRAARRAEAAEAARAAELAARVARAQKRLAQVGLLDAGAESQAVPAQRSTLRIP